MSIKATMAGLSLIETYSSGSENDEEESSNTPKVPEKNDEQPQGNLPLPQSIISFKGVEHHEEVIDNPLDHGGRTRTFKHERGNWSSFAFIEYKPDENVKNWIQSVCTQLPDDRYMIRRYHVSLTRTLILKYHWIDSFVDGIKKICANFDRFSLQLCDIKIYCNDERTRTFIGIRCEAVDESLKNITVAFDNLLAEYQLPPYYEDASYHTSIVSFNGDVEEQLKEYLPSLTASFENLLQENSGCRVTVDQLFCQIGCQLHIFPLK